MDWRVKGVVQKALSLIPAGMWVNDHLQRHIGALRNFEKNISSKVEDWKQTIRYLRDVGFCIENATLVEIGTGWYPTLPLCFSLVGAKEIISYDLIRHLNSSLTFRMLLALEPHLDSIAEIANQPHLEVRARYNQLRQAKDLATLLYAARVQFRAPSDARATGLACGTVDLVYSNSVMEHVRENAIVDLMREGARIVKSDGLCLHNIACNDHYAFFDKTISFVNYLRFDESKWEKWNNPLQYQNRLRAPEFINIAKQAGLEVIYQRTAVRPGTRDALSHLEIAPEFRGFSSEDLAITTIDFIAKSIRKAHA